jgi:ATP-binding cassette, subfamily B, bacterial MsbA
MLERILGKDLAYYVKSHRGLLVIALVLTAVGALFSVIPVYIVQPFVDEALKASSSPASWKIPWVELNFHGGFSWKRTDLVLIENISSNRLLIILSFAAFLSMLISSVARYFSQLLATAFSNRAIRSVRTDLFSKFVSLPLGFYHKRKAGELISRATNDLVVLQQRIATILIGLVEQPLTALVFATYVLVANFKLTLLIVIVVPAIVGFIRLFGRKVKRHSRIIQDNLSQVTSAYQETILCLKEVQGFCMNQTEMDKFKKLADKLYKNVMRWNRWNLGLSPLMDVTGFLALPGIVVVARVYFHLTLGELASLLYAYARLYEPMKSLARLNNELRTLQGATETVFSIMSTVPEIRDRTDAIELPRHRKSIEFNKVSFAYQSNVPVLSDVSLKVEAGEMIAFVGSTGAGKSTLLDLVPRFYDVTAGSITIDGIDLRDVTLDSLRRQIAMVSQEVLLFHDTIANNIRYADPERTMEEVIEAAKAAHAHDFITAQPHGYESMVGDRGTLLSGGQRQRLAIARAILSNPSILILDEAASALDAESERFIEEAIARFRGGRTILVAAHRLSTVKAADRICVLEGGRIVESGTREDLMNLGGRFRQLHDIQFRV